MVCLPYHSKFSLFEFKLISVKLHDIFHHILVLIILFYVPAKFKREQEYSIREAGIRLKIDSVLLFTDFAPEEMSLLLRKKGPSV